MQHAQSKRPPRPIRPTNGWAVISNWGDVHLDTVKWRRRDAIAAYVDWWEPVHEVPDWHYRPIIWRWNWIKRTHGCRVERVQTIALAGD